MLMNSNRLYLTLIGLIIATGFISCKSQSQAMDSSKQILSAEAMDTNRIFNVVKSEEEWLKELGPERYAILRQKGTERPFTGSLLNQNNKGIYTCGACNAELFTSKMKFDSHCGWPSFDNEIEGSILKVRDTSHGMIRTEILCANCGGHLGHIFDDGPTDTGLRYCVNSLSIDFIKQNP